MDSAWRRRGAPGGPQRDGRPRGPGGGGRDREAGPVPGRFRSSSGPSGRGGPANRPFPFAEPGAQAQDGGVRDDGDGGAGRVGGLPDHRPEEAVVHHRRGPRPARAAQAGAAPLSATAAPLQGLIFFT